MIRTILFLAFLLALSIPLAHAEQFDSEGFVVRIGPDCSVIVSHSSKANSEDAAYRLYGLGIPSPRQPFGPEAQSYLAKLLPKGTRISIKAIPVPNRDASSLPDALIQVYGKSVNYALIRDGMAWVDRQVCTGLYCRRWNIEEHRAVEARKGIWSTNYSTPPWQWAR